MRPPSGTAVCVSSRDDRITIAVGALQRVNCSLDEAHAVWRALTTTLFADGGKAPAWAMRIPEVSNR
jgi:hypothetical protein